MYILTTFFERAHEILTDFEPSDVAYKFQNGKDWYDVVHTALNAVGLDWVDNELSSDKAKTEVTVGCYCCHLGVHKGNTHPVITVEFAES